MNIAERFPPDHYETLVIQPFDRLLSRAWCAPGLTQRDLRFLCQVKRFYRSDIGVGLSNEELDLITKLAKRGGYKLAKARSRKRRARAESTATIHGA